MSNINVIKVIGKPLEKLIDVIRKGLGGNLNNKELKKEPEVEKEKFASLYPNIRIQERLLLRETKRQQNLDYINYIAGEQLSNEKSVSEEPLEDDWINRFFNIAEDISNEEMQGLWGRILAGEIKQPKSFSLRTLELLKNLSKDEAQVFTRFANLKISGGDKNFIYNEDGGKFLENKFGIKFTDRLLLTELGLIASENNLQLSLPETGNHKRTTVYNYGSKTIVINSNENTPKQAIKILVLTKCGVELSKLIQQNIDTDYLHEFCKGFKHENVNVKYGDLEKIGGRFLLRNKVDFK